MNRHINRAIGGLAVLAVACTSACGAPTSASGSRSTIASLATQNYVTRPPVTTAPPTPTTASPGSPGGKTTTETTYKVQSGESLTMIANKFKIPVEDLVLYNKFESANQVIFPNQEIKIPKGATLPGTSGSDGSSSSEKTEGSTATTEAGQGCEYKIVKGDNPSKVARKVGIDVDDLIAANQSSGVLTAFLPGDKLIIPPPGKCK